MHFVRLENWKDIYKGLLDFENCFPHLCEKIESLESFAKKLEASAYVYIACVENKAIGISCFYANDFENYRGYVTLIGVKRKQRGTGVGKGLLAFTEDVMRKNGMGAIRLEVDRDNVKAIGFYEHYGFKKEIEKESSFYMVKEL